MTYLTPLIVTALLSGCSHHPPDILAVQTIFNPICIFNCRAAQAEPANVKGNSNATQNAKDARLPR